MNKYIGLLLLGSCVLLSCNKGEVPEIKTYYGKIAVVNADLPGTPSMEWWFNGQKISKVGGQAKLIPATQSGKLEIYTTDTHQLLADSMLSISRNEVRNFKFAWSADYGIKGWISSVPVTGDSMAVQLLNNLSVAHYPVSAPDLYVVSIDINTLEVLDTIQIIPHFERGKLNPVKFTVPIHDANHNYIYYFGKLKDPATGEYIINQGLGLDLFSMPTDESGSPGSFNVYVVGDEDGFIAGQPVQL